LHDAFLAGQLLAKADNAALRKSILAELKADMIHSIETYQEQEY
jgi:hypothetical protein